MVTVSLDDLVIRQCSMLAVERWLMKKNSTDKASYADGRNKKYLEHDLVNSVRANVSEWAVAQYYALPWGGGITYPNSEHRRRRYVADVGANLEVRTRRTGGEFAFWPYETEKEGFAVFTEVVDDITFEEVRILGWLPIEECSKPEWFDKDLGRYYIPPTALRDPETLLLGNTLVEA